MKNKKLIENDNQANFRNLFNVINDFLFILDVNGNIVEINESVVKILGYTREDLKGKNVLLIHPQEHREKAAEIVGLMLQGKSEYCPLPLLASDGRYVPVETKITHGKWDEEDVLIGISRNMTELVASEEKFSKVFEGNQAMMAISDIKTGEFINVNKFFLETLGFTKPEIIGKSARTLNLFIGTHQREEFVQRVESDMAFRNVVALVRTKSGRILHCLFSFTKIDLQTRSLLLSSAIDISVLKETERKLQLALSRQTLLAEIHQLLNSPERIREKIDQILGMLGEYANVSRVYIFEENAKATAISNTHEWCNQNIKPQKDQLQDIPYSAIPSWKKLLIEGKIFSTNIRELPEDIVSVLEPQDIKSLLVLPIYVQDRFYGFIGYDECVENKNWEEEEVEFLMTVSEILSNAIERHLYRKQLDESEVRFQLAIEKTETGLWDWNIQTGEVFFNDVWCNMLGYTKDEIEPHVSSWENLVHPDDLPDTAKELTKHLNGEIDFYASSHRLKTKTNEWKWILDRGKIIEWDSNNKPIRMIGTHFDISNQKKTEEELRSLNRTKDKFFSIIAHDLRGPIGSLMQILEMVSERGMFEEEALYNILNTQKILSRNTYQLLENLLNWARYNQEQVKCYPKEVILNSIIEEGILQIQFQAEKKNIFVDFSGDDAHKAYADENMIKLVVRNILSNAMKFTRKGGRVDFELAEKDDMMEVSISDTGIGISEESVKKILSEDDFYSTSGTADEKGTGLGLKLCKHFVELNSGEFRIVSKPGEGSTISFTLPKAEVPN